MRRPVRLLTISEQKEQASRCGCRGSDDYCGCQNAPDRITRQRWAAEKVVAVLMTIEGKSA